jgi:uncharacterized RDD family membrane protein YckC
MIERRYQTFWPRFWSGWIDTLVFIPLWVVSYFIWKNHQHLSVYLVLFWYAINSFSYLIYSVLMHGKFGQTLGKMATSVKVCDISENQLSMSQAIRRDIIPLGLAAIDIVIYAPKILSGVDIWDASAMNYDAYFGFMEFASLGWFMTEIITMLFSQKRRALHDFIAGSVVIRLPQKSNPAPR